MVYQWKSASRIRTDPSVAGAMFEQLDKTVGLNPQTLLDANRPEGAPLHSEFEWDDTIAAESYRLSQARYMIRMLCIKESTTVTSEPVRAYFKLKESEKYESTSVILSCEDKYSKLLEQVYKELGAFLKRYQQIRELQPVRDAFDLISRSIEIK